MPEHSSFEEFIFSWCREVIGGFAPAEKPVEMKIEKDGVPDRVKVSIAFENGKTGSVVFHKTSSGGLKRIHFSLNRLYFSINRWDPEFFVM